MSDRKRYVVAGAGGRGIQMFATPLLKEHRDYCELTGLFDINPLRLQAARDTLAADLPLYTDFQRMLREANPDAVIIATRDCTHADYILQTLAAGKRAICEKPVCIDADQCRRLLEAQEKYRDRGAQCLVTHNLRYMPTIGTLWSLVKHDVIGRVLTVNFQENLDRRHGADYFRRWHRLRANTGGLLIHKGSHHFDALNWIVNSTPKRLVAQGGLMVYGKNGPFRGQRCDGCAHASHCEFYANPWTDEQARKMYRDAESADGYIRDACVFDEEIDIDDQMSLMYTYESGIRVTYSLSAFASYEGWRIEIEGTEGRLELREAIDTSFAAGSRVVGGTEQLIGKELILFSYKEGLKALEIPSEEGTHGGADRGIRRDFFDRPFDAPLTERQAPLEQAIQAVLIGHAANVSMANASTPVDIQSLLRP